MVGQKLDCKLKVITREDAFNYCDDELFDRISEKDVDLSPDIFCTGECVGIFNDAELIGFWFVVQINQSTFEIHINMKKEHRKYNKNTGKDFCSFMFNFPQVNKLVAYIPVIYPEVIKYTKNHGFEQEGYLNEHFPKDSGFIDCLMLGLTRTKYVERG